MTDSTLLFALHLLAVDELVARHIYIYMTSTAERTASSNMSATMNAARSQYRLEDMEIKNALGKDPYLFLYPHTSLMIV